MPLEIWPVDMTPNQRKVVALYNKGCSVWGISKRTGLSWKSVERAIQEVKEKIEADARRERKSGGTITPIQGRRASVVQRQPSALWTVAFVLVMLGSAAMAADGMGFFG